MAELAVNGIHYNDDGTLNKVNYSDMWDSHMIRGCMLRSPCCLPTLSPRFVPSRHPRRRRGRSTRSEQPQNRKTDHPRPRLTETSRVDGVTRTSRRRAAQATASSPRASITRPGTSTRGIATYLEVVVAWRGRPGRSADEGPVGRVAPSARGGNPLPSVKMKYNKLIAAPTQDH